MVGRSGGRVVLAGETARAKISQGEPESGILKKIKEICRAAQRGQGEK